MKNRISIQEVIAYNNTPKAKALVIRYGYNPPRNYDELVETLFQFVRDYREEALAELANIHPDKNLILRYTQKQEDKSNSDGGCNCKNCKSRYSNFEMADNYLDFTGGKSGSSGSKNKLEEYLPMIAIAGIFALAITSIGRS